MAAFTLVTPKQLMKFFGIDTYERARRVSLQIRRKTQTNLLTANHIAVFLGVPVSEVLTGIE